MLSFLWPILLLGLLIPAAHAAGGGDCSQPRYTAEAPAEFLERQSPHAGKGFDKRRARLLYESASGGTGCVFCHGRKGAGDGVLASRLSLPPRNFTCAAAMSKLPDGQLFWVIREGSEGTPMPPHAQLSDEEVWLLVEYVRSLSR